jgi:type I restriction enzyme, S subunit
MTKDGSLWPMRAIGELAADEPNSMTDGPFGSKLKTAHYTESGPRVIRLANIGDGNFIDAKAHISEAHFVTLQKHRVFPGDLVIAALGENPPRSCIVPDSLGPAIVKADCIRFKPGPKLLPRFANYVLNSDFTRRRLRGIVHGVGRPRLNLKEIKAIEIPLPPLDEQQRIVSEIEKQFARSEIGLAALNSAQANLKRYRRTIMATACAGTLVPTEAILARNDHRAYLPAHELIAQTTAPPRPNRWSSRSGDIIRGHAALAVGNLATQLPEGWAWCPLVDIARMESGHTPSREHPEWWGGNVAWISLPDARDHDGRAIHDTSQHTNEKGLENSAARLLPAGTVCISRTASVGYVVVMGEQMATSQDFVNWIPTPAVTSDWLRIVFSADREALRRFGKGSVHNTIYFPEWLSIHIALPPLAEQHRIVAEVERHLSVIEGIEKSVEANLQRAARLRQSILERAFSGRLIKSNVTGQSVGKTKEMSPASRRHFLRAVLSAEIVHQLHTEPTFGQTKHLKIFHLCEHIAEICELNVQYHRDAAGPYDNRLIYGNEAELKKQKWYESYSRKKVGHAYRPLAKAGGHEKYLERYWPEKLETIRRLIHLMRSWDTESCEIFSTAYAAWNDLLLWGQEASDDAIVHEVLHRWHESKQRIPEARWRRVLEWMRREGFVPTGFGKPTAAPRS